MTAETANARVELPKNSTEKVVIEAKTYHGIPLADIRIWYADGNPAAPTWKPSKKGICFRIEQLGEVLRALEKIAGTQDEDNGET